MLEGTMVSSRGGWVVGLLCTFLVPAAGCFRSVVWIDDESGGDSDLPDAASMPLPDCPEGAILVVDAHLLDDEFIPVGLDDPADAGETLSLREALAIAANRPGLDTVRFDAHLFGPSSGSAIVFPCDTSLEARGVCIDARDRSVMLGWRGLPVADPACPGVFILREGSMALGLTLVDVPLGTEVHGLSQIAGCRFEGGGLTAPSTYDVVVRGGVVGPGNVFLDHNAILIAAAGGAARVEGNYFGYDPLSGRLRTVHKALSLADFSGAMTVRGNVFALPPLPDSDRGLWSGGLCDDTSCSDLMFLDNFIGADSAGSPLGGRFRSVVIEGSSAPSDGRYFISRNTIRGAETAIAVLDGADGHWPAAFLSGNSISQSGQAIRYMSSALPGSAASPPVGPPVIEIFSGTEARGTCAVPGTVELFHDADGQAEVWLGDSPCTVEGGFQQPIGASIPSGRNLTATLRNSLNQTSELSVPFPVP